MGGAVLGPRPSRSILFIPVSTHFKAKVQEEGGSAVVDQQQSVLLEALASDPLVMRC